MESQAKDIYYNQGMKLEEEENYVEALECFNAVILLDEKHEDAWFYKGYCESQLKQYQKAVESYKQAIILDPKNKVALSNQGKAFYYLKQYQEALECYNKYIQLDDKYHLAWNGKGIALKNLGQYQEALECYNKCIQLDDQFHYAWYNKGNTLDDLGQYQEALECYSKCIQLDDKYHLAWNGKGVALKNLGQYQEALECYIKAISIQPRDMYYFNQGLVLEKMNQDKEAIQSYKEALKLNDKFQLANTQLQALESKQSSQKEESKAQENQPKLPGFIKEFSLKDQNLITEKFIMKLTQDQAFQWIGKFATLQALNIKEICSYYQYIMPFIISSNEASNIQIKQYNVKRGGFVNIHFGIFRDEAIAIKEQEFKPNDDNEFFISMLREISILLYCDHPNVSKIIAVYFNPKSLKLWIIQEQYFIDLSEALESKKIIPKKKQLIIQILEALNYIHSLELIYLDLKPKNLIFETSKLSRLLFLGFGISKLFKQNHDTDIQALSYFYSSPEVSNATKSTVTHKSDIFSFGIVLYEFITGKRAWKNYIGKGPIPIYTLIHSSFNFFKENGKTGNGQLDNLILDCVQTDPKKRPSAQDALERIKAIQF